MGVISVVEAVTVAAEHWDVCHAHGGSYPLLAGKSLRRLGFEISSPSICPSFDDSVLLGGTQGPTSPTVVSPPHPAPIPPPQWLCALFLAHWKSSLSFSLSHRHPGISHAPAELSGLVGLDM